MRNPERWLEVVEDRGHATAGRLTLSPAERLDERLFLGLRLAEGVPDALVSALPRDRISELIESGHLEKTADFLRVTPAGRLCLNAVTGRLLA